MDCKSASASLTAFIDGALASDESPLVAAHLTSCPSCRSRQSALAAARTAFARLTPESAPAGFDARRRRPEHRGLRAWARRRPMGLRSKRISLFNAPQLRLTDGFPSGRRRIW
ncbi:MAG: anti-sigma factor family protein [Elusimicrobiota bacterium]